MIALVPLLLAMALLAVPATTARARLHTVLTGPAKAPRSVLRAAEQGTSAQRTRLSAHLFRAPLFVPVTTGVSVAILWGGWTGLLIGIGAALVARWLWPLWVRHRERTPRTHPLSLAAGWDLLSAGMRSGLPVPVTVRAVAAEFTGAASSALHEVADLLALGCDPVSAWAPAMRDPDTVELARAARRTARTGSGLADVAADIASEARAAVGEHAQARAQRAAVWVSAPLGLCFLPAFLCLGVLPVVVGMVHRMTSVW